jgi:Zn ribbon nucleic-acid-binding protein
VNTPSRLFVRCGACQARSAFVVGRDGHEVRECSSCGRRRSVRDEVHRKLHHAGASA